MKENVIAIDGPAASGKSTAARKLAEKLNIPYISTGAMFRAIAWKAKKKNISLQNPEQIALMLHETVMTYVPKCAGDAPEICIDGIFPGAELRTPEIASGASQVAVYPAVRNYTLKIQRELAEKQLVVMEGRDIGTVVFPNAKYKFFLTASPHARAVRRLSQNGETPASQTVESVAAEIAARDKLDSERPIAPLKKADDAILIDSSDFTAEETLQRLMSCIKDIQ